MMATTMTMTWGIKSRGVTLQTTFIMRKAQLNVKSLLQTSILSAVFPCHYLIAIFAQLQPKDEKISFAIFSHKIKQYGTVHIGIKCAGPRHQTAEHYRILVARSTPGTDAPNAILLRRKLIENSRSKAFFKNQTATTAKAYYAFDATNEERTSAAAITNENEAR